MKKIYLLLLLMPITLLADTKDNLPCLQTLICNVNGTFLKDNRDNRACIGSALSAGVNLENLDDQTITCLSRSAMENNPLIDFNLGRIDPIPPRVELPEAPELVFFVDGFPRERAGDSVVTTTDVVITIEPTLEPATPLMK